MKEKLIKSPLAPSKFPKMFSVDGVNIATVATGMKYQGRDDLLIIDMAEGTTVAGALTKSSTSSAPVDWCRKNLKTGEARALIVNAGNANAFTGSFGIKVVNECVTAVADKLACRPSRVFVASTGVIGELLPYELITTFVEPALKNAQPASPKMWKSAASAILTTDTFAKGSTALAKIGDVEVSISGIAKGSGMIAPDMATMLAFIFTDAKIPPDILDNIVQPIVDKTFNSITVDSDTSTSDTLLVFATGEVNGQHEILRSNDDALANFKTQLEYVMLDLAMQVVRDGEGASKLILVEIIGAKSDNSARSLAFSIANSPLVKTAISGEDANWGRIVMALGKSGESIEKDKLIISVGEVEIASGGSVVEGYNEDPVAEHMKGDEISIKVDIGIGNGKFKVWTCDLSHGYIDINADYRS